MDLLHSNLLLLHSSLLSNPQLSLLFKLTMSSVAPTTDIDSSSIAPSELQSPAKVFHLIPVAERAFGEVLNLTGFADAPPSQMELTRSGKIVIYKKEYAEVFEKWFNTTPYAQFVERLNQTRETDPNSVKIPHKLPEWDNPRRKGKVWVWFWEGSECLQGMPKVVCKSCEQSMQHPGAVDQGTTNMRDHMKSSGCERKAKRSSATQSAIDQHLHRVSILFVFNIYHHLTDNDNCLCRTSDLSLPRFLPILILDCMKPFCIS